MNIHNSKDQKWRDFGVIALVYVLLSLLLAMPVEALRLKTDWAKRVDLSEKIVRGQVIDVKSYWNPERTLIYTDVTILIDEHIKGDGAREVILTIPGGTVGDDTHLVSDTPQFNVGDYGVILLEPSGQVAGGPDGVYLLQKPMVGEDQIESLEGDKFLSWVKDYISGKTKHSFGEMPEEASSMPMQQAVSYATISGASPSTISAGTGSVLTISGSGFGSSRGSGNFPTICFRFYENVCMFSNSAIRSWSDTQIKVNVWTGIVYNPYVGWYYHSPGSWGDPYGTVIFVNKSGSAESFYALTVDFGYGHAKWAAPLVSYHVPVCYYINGGSGLSGALSAIQNAANTWNGAGSSFLLNYKGETTRGWGHDGYSVIGFSNLGSSTIIAQATSYISSGAVIESDVQFNTQFPFSTDPTPPANKMDLQTIATHELGHWLRLLDLYGENDADKIMYGFGDYGQVKRDLTSGDRLGINWIYPEKTPPTPDPMTWVTVPYKIDTNSISMASSTATDPTSPISYYFDFVGSPTGGTGGTDSGWQSSTTYTDTGLQVNHKYGYRVKAKDGLNNQTAYSTTQYAYTAIQASTGVTFGTVTPTSIQARSTNTPSGLSRSSSGLWIENTTNGTNSGWKRNNTFWTNKPLSPNTQYSFHAKTKNGDGIETDYGPPALAYSGAKPPGKASFSNVTRTSIRANWTANGNPDGTEYFCQNVTTGTDSGWITNTFWDSNDLFCSIPYRFRVKARNGDGSVTAWTPLGSQSTVKCIVLLAPNGGEIIPSGSIYDSIRWDPTPEAGSFDLFYSLDSGTTWNSIEKDVRTTSSLWSVPKTAGNKKACLVKVIGYDAARTKKIGSDTSDATFTIEVVTVISPNGGEVFHAGEDKTMEWRACSDAVKFDLKLSLDNGATWYFLDDGDTPGVIEGKGVTGTTFTTKILPPSTGNKKTCLLKVIAYNAEGKQIGSDTSDKPFTIEVVELTSPNGGGDPLKSGDPIDITWTTYQTSQDIAKVQLYITKDGAATWNLITTLSGTTYPPGDYSQPWTVPPVGTTPKTNCKVKVVLTDAKGVMRGSDVSDNFFTIQP